MCQGVQYQALRIIYKAPIKTSSKEMHTKANIETMNERLTNLSKSYLRRAISNDNKLISKLVQDYTQLRLTQPSFYSPINIINNL